MLILALAVVGYGCFIINQQPTYNMLKVGRKITILPLHQQQQMFIE